MPRQDYSLPSIVPIPKLARVQSTPRPPVQAQQEEDLVVVEASNAQENKSDNDSDYDMLDDDCEIFRNLQISPSIPSATTDSTSTSTSTTGTSTTKTGSSPFVDMLLKDAEESSDEDDANMTTTENGAPTFISTGDARLDFFFEVLQNTSPETTNSLVRTSWASNPLDTLRLIFQLRSVLHGKGERDGFYTCMDFLRKEHPKTLLYNLRFVPDHGYWKDLLNWLVFEVREDTKNHSMSTGSRTRSKASRGGYRRGRGRGGFAAPTVKRSKHENEDAGTQGSRAMKTEEERERAIAENHERNQQLSIKARAERLDRDQARLDRARAKFTNDAYYRTLHLEIARLFANALVRDKARLAQGKSISLAAKWCPSLGQFHDNHTLIASTIAQILYPEKRPSEDHVAYVNRVRQQFRQEYYVPLRKAIPVLETFMAAQKWDEIQYNRVPSIAMKNNKKLFEARDKERFEKYLQSVSKGETTIAAQALLPHELVTEARRYQGTAKDDLGLQTLEAQWKSYVERLAKIGTMESAMAMCDVSGSMTGIPMEVAIALSLLLSQLSRPPFNGLVLTFSASPQVHRIQGNSLVSQVQSLSNMDWGMNTDLAKAFDHILNLAVKNKLAKEDMVKTLFIFSDMEFDQAVSGARQGEMFTNYAVVKRRFEKEGYDLPQIVFWNLRGSYVGNKPTKGSQPGVAMVSGYSGMLMKLFLDGEDMAKELNPVRLMEKAIGAKEFSKLVVLD
ncbi:hypothetical protein BGX34_000719 [Mortierella sp. NVP85]|nr:hypothetical protein BGX34_000719 [Mortierella sp. NVP85]